MDNEQKMTTANPADMAEFFAKLTDTPELADEIRRHEAATRIVTGLIFERLRQGMTQRDLARKMGVSASTVCRFEDKPDEELELGFLSRYANALGCHMAIIFDDMSQTDAAKIKSNIFAIQKHLENLTSIARTHADDARLCEGIAKFQAEVLLNFLVKYGESADIPRVIDFFPHKEPEAAPGKPAKAAEKGEKALALA